MIIVTYKNGSIKTFPGNELNCGGSATFFPDSIDVTPKHGPFFVNAANLEEGVVIKMGLNSNVAGIELIHDEDVFMVEDVREESGLRVLLDDQGRATVAEDLITYDRVSFDPLDFSETEKRILAWGLNLGLTGHIQEILETPKGKKLCNKYYGLPISEMMKSLTEDDIKERLTLSETPRPSEQLHNAFNTSK